MKLNITAMALAAGLLWGGAMLLVALGNLMWPPYGAAFLNFAASIYPGYAPSGEMGSAIMGTLYALVDGAIGGLIFAWVYNRFAT